MIRGPGVERCLGMPGIRWIPMPLHRLKHSHELPSASAGPPDFDGSSQGKPRVSDEAVVP